APAQDAVEYEIVKFHSGPLNNETDDIYSLPPSPEVDQAWRDLYEVGAVVVTADIASRVVNRTEMKDDQYVFGIDVFHQLHCLNKIRKALSPDYYGSSITESKEVHEVHMTHCLNSIRQSLQCSGDISPIPFNVQPFKFSSKSLFLPTFNVLHSCRNFGKIQEWTRERWTGEPLDLQ
ncbi:hypothetical protein BT96DRAFT_809589, partial [Gymnopus androsaceus JB14]